MIIKNKTNKKIITKDFNNEINGFLIPIYNINDNFFEEGKEPQQVYLTVIKPKQKKGPHLHFIRTGCFTCIKGNARIILKINEIYEIYLSGDDHEYKSIIIPKGVPAVLQNISSHDAYILNMPYPAWTPEMNDEHTADFSDFDFNNF
jgi:dTDP-4-dehydrorhamnose 3,5-epimerase